MSIVPLMPMLVLLVPIRRSAIPVRQVPAGTDWKPAGAAEILYLAALFDCTGRYCVAGSDGPRTPDLDLISSMKRQCAL